MVVITVVEVGTLTVRAIKIWIKLHLGLPPRGKIKRSALNPLFLFFHSQVNAEVQISATLLRTTSLCFMLGYLCYSLNIQL